MGSKRTPHDNFVPPSPKRTRVDDYIHRRSGQYDSYRPDSHFSSQRGPSSLTGSRGEQSGRNLVSKTTAEPDSHLENESIRDVSVQARRFEVLEKGQKDLNSRVTQLEQEMTSIANTRELEAKCFLILRNRIELLEKHKLKTLSEHLDHIHEPVRAQMNNNLDQLLQQTITTHAAQLQPLVTESNAQSDTITRAEIELLLQAERNAAASREASYLEKIQSLQERVKQLEEPSAQSNPSLPERVNGTHPSSASPQLNVENLHEKIQSIQKEQEEQRKALDSLHSMTTTHGSNSGNDFDRRTQKAILVLSAHVQVMQDDQAEMMKQIEKITRLTGDLEVHVARLLWDKPEPPTDSGHNMQVVPYQTPQHNQVSHPETLLARSTYHSNQFLHQNGLQISHLIEQHVEKNDTIKAMQVDLESLLSNLNRLSKSVGGDLIRNIEQRIGQIEQKIGDSSVWQRVYNLEKIMKYELLDVRPRDRLNELDDLQEIQSTSFERLEDTVTDIKNQLLFLQGSSQHIFRGIHDVQTIISSMEHDSRIQEIGTILNTIRQSVLALDASLSNENGERGHI